MNNNFFKQIISSIFTAFLFSLFFSHTLYALPPDPVSETVSISAQVGEIITVTPGGGGGSIVIPKTAVRFSGFAYPNADVVLLKQGERKIAVKASSSGEFSITLEENYNTNILYSLFAQDVGGNRSLLLNYPIVVQAGFITHLSGIRFAPTIVTDKSQVLFGDYLTVTGYALPQAGLEIIIKGMQEKTFTLISSNNGSYKIVLPMSGLDKGEYDIYIHYTGDSRFSKLIKFTIGNSNIFYTENLSNIPGDCNVDKIINLVDFSILAFWYGKNNPPVCVDTNADKIINLVDFSILAFYWTG